MATEGTAASEGAAELHYLEGSERPAVLRLSDALRSFVDFVGRWASWLFVPLIIVTVFDVAARKMVWVQIWLVENLGRISRSTRTWVFQM